MEDIFYKDQMDDGNQVASSVQLNNLTAETSTTTTTLVNLNKVEKSSICCPTPTSFVQCLIPKGKQLPKHLPSHQSKEENIQIVDEIEIDLPIVFPQLKQLFLDDVPELRVMYNGNHAIECQSSEELTISDCNNMEGLSYGSFIAPNIKKLNLQEMKNIPKWLHLEHDSGIPRLQELIMYCCNEITYLVDAMTDQNLPKPLLYNLEDLWIERLATSKIGQPQPCFTHLTNITIWKCPKLKHVFPLSVATELTQLQKLVIKKCKEMEEIFYKVQVADGNQKASSVESNSPTTRTELSLPYSSIPTHQIIEENIDQADEIEVDLVTIFPQLKLLCLEDMPKLRVMYNGNHAIECPSLEELIIRDCNNMEGLSYGSFGAPKIKTLVLGVRHLKNIAKWLHFEQDSGIPWLEKLMIYSCPEIIYMVDAMPKPLFYNLEHLWIESMDSLEEIWNGPYLSIIQPQPCFTHLTNITIKDCPKLKHVFPLSVATKLTQLLQLEIERRAEMEEIFYEDRVADGNQNASRVELISPTTVTESTPPSSFIPSHQTMEENTAQLDEKEVDCAIKDALVIFPQLKLVKLFDLSKLRIFYNGNHAIESPSLESLEIFECKEIKALSKGSFNAPKLKTMWINATFTYPSAAEDLNTVVRKTEDEKDKDGDENEDTASDTDEDEYP